MPKKTTTAAPKPAAKPKAATPNTVVSIRNIDAAPTDSFPTVARTFKALDPSVRKHMHQLTEEEQKTAGSFGEELRATDAQTYTETFTNRAPDKVKLADRIELAIEWQKRSTAAQAYAAYSDTMAVAAWDAAGRDTRGFATKFRSAAKEDASVAGTYPASSAFFGVRSAIATRGVNTRRAKRRASKKAADGTTKKS